MTHDAVPGGLSLERGDGDAFPHELIHQRALADVWVAYDIDESCLMFHCS